MFIDSHCHLDFPDFKGDISGVVSRAVEFGVKQMLTICTRLEEEPRVRIIAENYKSVVYAAGIHPLYIHECSRVPTVEALCALAVHPKMIGIGETGLDYFRSHDTQAQQQHSLNVHIEAAQETGLPLIIHNRASDKDMAKILMKSYAQKPFSCVMHCFSSSSTLARTALDLGFYLSMSGIVTFKNSQSLRDIFSKAPLDRILLETDSPYLAPTPYRGKRNEPAYVAITAKTGAEIYNLSLESFGRATTENFYRLFSKIPRVGSS